MFGTENYFLLNKDGARSAEMCTIRSERRSFKHVLIRRHTVAAQNRQEPQVCFLLGKQQQQLQ